MAGGAMWTVLCSVLSKGATFLGQIALAWILVPSEFGLASMALSVGMVAKVLSASGLRDVLIQRPDSDEVLGQAFWLACLLHSMAGLVILLAAPLAGTLFHDGRVVPLVVLVALSEPLAGLSTIYTARLQRNMKFGTLARIQLGAGALNTLLSVILAVCGFGALAIIMPRFAVLTFNGAAARRCAGRIEIPRPRPRVWMPLVVPAGWLMLQGLITTLQTSGTTFTVGMLGNARLAGLFAWGQQIALQALYLLALNLRPLLFSSLTRLNAEPVRQRQAMETACNALTVVLAPICILQALLAPVLVPLVFGPQWGPASHVISWLSLSGVTMPMTVLGAAVLLAHGEFRALTVTTVVQGGLVVSAVSIAMLIGGDLRTVGIAVSVAVTATNVIPYVLSQRMLGQRYSKISKEVGMALGLGGLLACSGGIVNAMGGVHAWASHVAYTCAAVTLVWSVMVAVAYPDVVSYLKRISLLQFHAGDVN